MAPDTKVYTGRYLRMGGTFGITVPPELRERLGFIRGDYVLWLIIGDVLRVTKVTPAMILKRELPDSGSASTPRGSTP